MTPPKVLMLPEMLMAEDAFVASGVAYYRTPSRFPKYRCGGIQLVAWLHDDVMSLECLAALPPGALEPLIRAARMNEQPAISPGDPFDLLISLSQMSAQLMRSMTPATRKPLMPPQHDAGRVARHVDV